LTAAFEFASDAWLNELERVIRSVIQEATSSTLIGHYSLSEVYLNPPPDIGSGGVERVCWTCRIEDGAVSFAREPDETCDLYIEIDYAAARNIARLSFHGAAGRDHQAQVMADLIASGELIATATADPPAFLNDVHNRMAVVTS
jgi:hypothetical protein